MVENEEQTDDYEELKVIFQSAINFLGIILILKFDLDQAIILYSVIS